MFPCKACEDRTILDLRAENAALRAELATAREIAKMLLEEFIAKPVRERRSSEQSGTETNG